MSHTGHRGQWGWVFWRSSRRDEALDGLAHLWCEVEEPHCACGIRYGFFHSLGNRRLPLCRQCLHIYQRHPGMYRPPCERLPSEDDASYKKRLREALRNTERKKWQS